jgi:trimeric autotransporter adhesin
VSATAPTAAQVLSWNAASSAWEPQTLSVPVSQVSGAFANGGNSFGGAATLGTNDNFNLNFETNGATAMTILSDGTVGIGTASTTNLLTVQKNSNAENGIDIRNTSTGGTAAASYYMRNSTSAGQFGMASTGHTYAGNISRNRAFIWADANSDGILTMTDSNDPILFATNTTERMRILGTGNVGIGTASPTGKLDVVSADSGTTMNVINSSSTAPRYPGINVTNYTGAQTAGHSTISLQGAAGSLGAMTAYPGNRMIGALSFEGAANASTWNQGASIVSYANSTYSATNAESDLRFNTAPNGSVSAAERMRIQSNGNVGIGTTNPQSLLHVNGIVRATDICDENGANCKDISAGWGGGGDIDGVYTGTGLAGGFASGSGTLSVDVGTTANKIVQLDASARLPGINGSQLTNVNAVQLQTRNVAATAPTASQVLAWNAASSEWQPMTVAGG